MNPKHSNLILFMIMTCSIAGYTSCFAQRPIIRQVDKTSGFNGETVTIQGTFPGDLGSTAVWFGGAKGSIQFLSDQLIEVEVPAGATFDNIVVTDIATGLSDESDLPFHLSFGGNHGITTGDLQGQRDFNSESGLYDLCMCDFDNDKRTDIATANDGANSINVLANTTTAPGLTNISFNRIPFLIGARSIHAKCGDLNGDGKPDLIISEGGSAGDRIFIFRNTSTGEGVFTFSIQSIRLSGKKVKQMEIADLDLDGKPEVIVTDQTGNDVTVLVNESTTAAITFSTTPLTLTIAGAETTDGIAVEDLDADGLPEIVTSQFLTQTSNIVILENTSQPGNVSFAPSQLLPISGTVVNLRIADLDGDRKPDITATQLIGSGTISIFRNESAGAIAFASAVSFPTDMRPWGIDVGDIDGDGLPDIVVSSLERSISILNNVSTIGNLDFSSLIITTTFINRHVKVGDIDTDGKPDILFTSVDDNNNNIPASKVSVFRNNSCLVPLIKPAGPVTICEGLPFRLTTIPSGGTTYEWKNGATSLATSPDSFLDVTASGTYTVTATNGGTCSNTSNAVTVTVATGTTTGTAIPTNDGPVCPGNTLSLSVNDVGATAYQWTGPNGYASTGLSPDPIIDFQAANAGRYFVDVVVNGCIAQQASTVAEMISVPDFKIAYAGADVICPPDTKTLTLVPDDPGFSYQWSERATGDIAGATGTTLSATHTGEYFVKAQSTSNPGCPAIESSPAAITFSSPPVAQFSAPAVACVSGVVKFVNESTGNTNLSRSYHWEFGDDTSLAGEEAEHVYRAASTYDVTLTASYSGACEVVATRSITIESPPAVAITTPGGSFEICNGGSLLLEVTGGYDSYQWSTGATTSRTDVFNAGTYTVDVIKNTCAGSATVSITSLPDPVVTATADPIVVNEGESSQLTAGGLTTYHWEPQESLSDPLAANPIASPTATTVYIVRGTDHNGCSGSAAIEVGVKGDLIINKIHPSKFISPNNGDSMNNFWVVENILDYPQCSVAIYDDKGIKVYEAKPYHNDWAGTYNGKELPDGVYYFIIRCDGEESTPRSGSITVLR